jgi:hypothetical protein
MKKVMTLTVAVVLAALLLVSCEGDRGPTGPPGTNLTINTVNADPFYVGRGDTSVVTVSVTYAGDDTLAYTWTASGGEIIGSGAVVLWKAPTEVSTEIDDYVISVTVSDGKYAALGHVTIRVGESMPAWTRLSPTGDVPAGRGWHATVYDGLHNKMVIYGGYYGGTFTHDCYALDLTSLVWHRIPEPYPTGREDALAVWDEPNDRMILYGGGHAGAWYNSTYALDLSGETWAEVITSVDGTVPGGAPPRRAEPAGIYDPVGKRMVVFGGRSSTFTFQNDTYALSLDTPGSEEWTRIHPGGAGAPEPRYVSEAVYDPVDHAMILFGGGAGGPNPLNDVWSLDLTSHEWSQLQPTGSIPPPLFSGRQMIYEPSTRWVVVFSGSEGEGGDLIDGMWALDLDNLVWYSFDPGSNWPASRMLASFVYDSGGERTILWGGFSGNIPGPPAASDCWMLEF